MFLGKENIILSSTWYNQTAGKESLVCGKKVSFALFSSTWWFNQTAGNENLFLERSHSFVQHFGHSVMRTWFWKEDQLFFFPVLDGSTRQLVVIILVFGKTIRLCFFPVFGGSTGQPVMIICFLERNIFSPVLGGSTRQPVYNENLVLETRLVVFLFPVLGG